MAYLYFADQPPALPAPAMQPAPEPAPVAVAPTPVPAVERAPPPPARIKRPPQRPRPRAFGFVTINSLPWSRVKLDGRPRGNTPLVKLRVAAGYHRLELLSGSGQPRKALKVRVVAGKTRTFTFDFSARGSSSSEGAP